jgi:capsular exopolysaccharide synthesis family protein
MWQGRWTVLAIFLLVVGLTAVWSFLQTPVYRATAIVEVQPQARRLLSSGDVSGMGATGFGWFAEEKYHNTQVEIIKSRDVSRRVVRTLGLAQHPLFAEVTDPVDAFRKMIQVDPRRDTGLLEISFSGTDPQEIAQWANAVAREYTNRNFEKAKENVEQAVSTIREQLAALRGDLAVAEEERIGALQDEESEIYNSETQNEIVREKLQSLSAELTTVSVELSKLEGALRQIQSFRRTGGDLMSLPEFASNSTLQELKRDRVAQERELETVKVQFRTGHPEYEKKQAALTSLQQRIDEQVDLVIHRIESEHALAQSHANYLREQIRLAEEYSLQVAKATSRYDIVKTDAETQKQIVDLIAMTMREVQLNAELMNNNVALLDEAVPSQVPIAPRKRMNLMIGAMFGVFLGIGVVFFLDYLDNTIRTPEDVEKYLGLSVISVVPRMQGEPLSERAVKEAYQSLRTSIIFSSKNRQRRAILITSTGPREGKSSTIANLGRTLAAAGDRVIVVDCDLRRPKQQVHFKIEREPGLTNYLAARAEDGDWERFVQRVSPAGLYVLTSGPLPPSPPELLGGSRFKHLLEALRERYDWVLIDSPPSASLADATLLASLADMVVLVVQHNATDRDHVVKTVQRLGAHRPVTGVVLNNVDLSRAYHKDYYYTGYYYEEDGTREKRPRRSSMERKAQVG